MNVGVRVSVPFPRHLVFSASLIPVDQDGQAGPQVCIVKGCGGEAEYRSLAKWLVSMLRVSRVLLKGTSPRM